MKKVIGQIFIAVLVIVILLGIGVYLFLETDLFKTNEQLFLKYAIEENINEISKLNFKPYEKLDSKESGYEFSGTLNFDTSKDELNLDRNLDMIINSNSDAKTDKSSASYVIKFGEEDLLKINYLRNNEKYGIKLDEITDEKYVVIENNNLRDLLTRLGMTDISDFPNKIEPIKYNYENIDLSKVKEIEEKYIKVIENQISNNKFSAQRNVTLNIDGENISTNKYTLEITKAELYNVIYAILDNLKDDKQTLQFYMNIVEDKNLTITELEANVGNLIQDLEIQKDNFVETETITISVYTCDGKTVKTEFKNTLGEGIAFSLNTINNINELIIELIAVKNEQEGEFAGNTTAIKLTNEAKDNEIKLNISLNLKYNQDDINAMKNGGESAMSFAEIYNDKSMQFNFLISDLSDEHAKITGDGKYNDINLYTFAGELKKGGEYALEDITSENSVIMNSCSDDEFNKLISSLTEKSSEILSQKAETVVPGITLMIDSMSNTSMLESPIYLVDPNAGEIGTISVELNNALMECLNSYITAYTSDPESDIEEYMNEENVKKYCPNAKDIIFTNAGVRYVTNDDKIYEGVVDTDMEDGYITIKNMKLVE